MAAPSAEDFQAQVDELVALTAILEPGLVRVLGPHSLFPSSASSSASAVAAEDLSGDFDPSSLYGAAPIAGIELQVLMEAQLPEGAEEIALHLRPQGDAPETACSAPIDHLPFLVLRVTFPAGYPSAEMPHARIAAPWLTQTAADAILEDLRLVWEEQGGPGLPVVFTWVEAIRARALDLTTSPGAVPVLVISPQTVAEPSRTEEEEDRPARGEEAGPSTGPGLDPDDRDWARAQQLFFSLVAHNERRATELFEAVNHECSICFSELPGPDFHRLLCARDRQARRTHALFCRGCLTDQCTLHVREGTLDQLKCPDTACARPLHPVDLSLLLTEDEYARWEGLSLSRALDAIQDLTYCPRCQSACLEQGGHLAQCEQCMFAFCTLCSGSYHTGRECMTAEERLRVLESRSQGRALSEAARLELLRKKQDLKNEAATMTVVRRTCKICPVCSMAVEKDGGCNKITCSNCSAYFCWRCNKLIEGYDHFKEGSGTACAGQLFELEDIRRWEVEFEGQLRAQRGGRGGGGGGGAAAGADEGSHCSRCGQYNVKVAGNNHIRCRGCQGAYCALCLKTLMKGEAATHFVPPQPCPQHGSRVRLRADGRAQAPGAPNLPRGFLAYDDLNGRRDVNVQRVFNAAWGPRKTFL